MNADARPPSGDDFQELTEEQAPREPGSPAPHVPADNSNATKLRRRRPEDTLLAHQLEVAVPHNYPPEIRTAMLNSAFDLYSSLDPQDGVESVLARQIVALNNFIMEALCVGSMYQSSFTVHYIALAMKGAQVLGDLLKFYDGRRAGAAQILGAPAQKNPRLAKPKATARFSVRPVPGADKKRKKSNGSAVSG